MSVTVVVKIFFFLILVLVLVPKPFVANVNAVFGITAVASSSAHSATTPSARMTSLNIKLRARYDLSCVLRCGFLSL